MATPRNAWLAAVTDERMLEYEQQAVESGFHRIAGVDEAGRGPLAGPIVAGAVVLASPIPGVDDSKKLSESQRDSLFDAIMDGKHLTGVAVIEPSEIDRAGIQVANYAAMTQAAQALDPRPDFLLVDGFTVHGCAIPQQRIVKGDQKSQSIAAASIVAKVTRDRIMRELDERYPGYGFADHKGYGTRRHVEALLELGPCAAHRMSFAPIAKLPRTAPLFANEDA